MRKIFLLLTFLYCSLAAFGQKWPPDTFGVKKQLVVHRDGADFLNYLRIPTDTITVGWPAYARAGRVGIVAGVFYYNDGSAWITPAQGSSVVSVQGFTGVVNLTTTNIPEGSNLYFTNARVYNDSAVLLAYVKTLIAGKVGYADTAHMLLHYMHYGDSISVYATMYGLDTADANIRDWARSTFLTSFSETDPFSQHNVDSNTFKHFITLTYANNNYYPRSSNPAGYLVTETDPIFTASIAFYLTAVDTTHYNTAYQKYPASLGFNTGSGLLTLTRNDGTTVTVNLDGRYLTSYSETDPIFVASVAHNIAAADTTHWHEAWAKYTLSGSFGTGTGTVTYTRNDGTTWTVNIDGRYGKFVDSNSYGNFITRTYAEAHYQPIGSYITLGSLSATAPITYNSGTGAIGFDYTYAGTFTTLQTFNVGIAVPSVSATPSTPSTGFKMYSPSDNSIRFMGTGGLYLGLNGTTITASRVITAADHNFTLDNLSTATTTTNGYFKGVAGLGTFVTAIPGSDIASSVALAGSPTTTTQSAGDNSTKIATTAYVDVTYSPQSTSTASYTTSMTPTSSVASVPSTVYYDITAQAGALLFNNPTGSWANHQLLIFRIKDNGTARALTYGTNFRAGTDVTPLPATTVLSKTLYEEFMYNSTDTKFDLVGKADGF